MSKKCIELYDTSSNAEEHWESLDDIWSQQMSCNFKKYPEAVINAKHVALEAHNLLQRFPRTSIQLPEYDKSSTTLLNPPTTRPWETLQLSSRIDTNVVRLALVTTATPSGYQALPRIVNTMAEMVEVAASLASGAQSSCQHQRWLIVRGFLWSSWQRTVMLWFHIQVGWHLGKVGYQHDNLGYSFLRYTFPAPGVSTEQYSRQVSRVGKADYMCNWALELLR